MYTNPVNLGDYSNRNQAAAYARGEFLKYLDSDDLIYPHGLATMLACMRINPDAMLGLSQTPDPTCPFPAFLSPAEAYRQHFFQTDLFGRSPGSSIIRRSAFEAVRGFKPSRYVGDQELWFRLTSKFGLVKMPRDLVWIRLHGEQEGSSEPLEVAALRHAIALEFLQGDNCPLTREERDGAERRLEERNLQEFWMLVVKARMREALRYRHCLNLGARSLVGFCLKKLLRAGASAGIRK